MEDAGTGRKLGNEEKCYKRFGRVPAGIQGSGREWAVKRRML
jgi:hypothetical protein